MITRVEVRNFRMLRATAFSLRPFAVLVGKNATGKSTLISALRFVSDLVRGGVPLALENALERDAPSFPELCFDPAEPIEIALELEIEGRRVRYEVAVAPDESAGVVVRHENLFLVPAADANVTGKQLSLLGDAVEPVHTRAPAGWRPVVKKTEEGKDYFQDEKTNWTNVFKFGVDRSALGAMPEDENRFPFTLHVRDFLRDGVQFVELDSRKLREPSPPRSPRRLLADGSNLARAALALREGDRVAFDQWVSLAATAVEGLHAIDVWERPEDKKLILLAEFGGQHSERVPSWLLSDGTLRLLALTLLSYSGLDTAGAALIEEPENGLHPLAMQAVHGALSKPGEGRQVLVATHSPVFLAQVSLAEVLVFSRLPDGSAQIRRGDEVSALKNWRKNASLADVFAAGVLA